VSFLPPENHVHLREEQICNPLGLQASLLVLTFNLELGYLLSCSCRVSSVLQTLVIFILAIIIQSSQFPRNCHLILLLLVLVKFMQPIFQGTLAQQLCADPSNCHSVFFFQFVSDRQGPNLFVLFKGLLPCGKMG
jgi:hypothetical protein